ncbi:hypothetical protein COCC4DRAFT_145389 [Bipolaris maydis ATCC 48331]|uniref:Uncharacterized protein n=3 Tax=Cochliobolus heterostrophus TaxID=5016 RepID=M2T354_COCH5|nr:uncharacterized protein COCC4DRAFT_145389 [Bipolaris maydis ATCC 48331]EMD92010.1 hypothetical protein COCHEDRAFT_1213103 [Bipolaris maydis C5]KAJ5021382.1 hypothetical protein J3E73DRAFT_394765 [Bipolaris maydis]ENI02507.1 hypothetical protein COCC4DRAFT_145389 [Bipolaris maydis ATCC 48331]KAJ6210617.1 hypothetical protein PSV09DRAFT_1213103 [Bipolaris maydis]KAJ6282047.1 hypothetical protein J3E71DRAFT_362140 [Bipolaris maydis]
MLRRTRQFTSPEESVGELMTRCCCLKNPPWQKDDLCWDVRGEALKAYNSFSRLVWKKLENECTERPDRSGLIISVYMIGYSPSTAVPVLVFVSKNRNAAKEAQKIVKKSGILKRYPGFETAIMDLLPTGSLVLVAQGPKKETQDNLSVPGRREVYYDPRFEVQSIGMALYVRDDDGTFEKATGNAVISEQGLGYFTAAHVFKAQDVATEPVVGWGEDTSVDNDSDSDEYDDDDLELLSRYSQSSQESLSPDLSQSTTLSSSSETIDTQDPTTSAPSPPPINAPSSSVSMTPPKTPVNRTMRANDIDLHHLGHWTPSSPSSTLNQDWTLVTITNTTVLSSLSNSLTQPLPKPLRLASLPYSHKAEVVIHTTWGRLRASLLETPVLLRLPGSSKVAEVLRFEYRGSLGVADCGSLVVGERTGEVYGHVVAGAAEGREGYMISAVGTMGEMQVGGWKVMELVN